MWKSYQDKKVDIVKFKIENKHRQTDLADIYSHFNTFWDDFLLEITSERNLEIKS